MKVITLSESDISGGAARAAYRLHNALRCAGIDSRMLVLKKNSNDSSVVGPLTGFEKTLSVFLPRLDSLPKTIYRNRKAVPFSVSWLGSRHWLRAVKRFVPDVVHLHWVNNGFVTPRQLVGLGTKPLVWSLHDMWAFTGGCHYSNAGCQMYKVRCGRCPALRSTHALDLSWIIWKRKALAYATTKNFTVVGLSTWVTHEARQSSLLRDTSVVNLPNTIDTSKYRPCPKRFAKQLWNLRASSNVVLFGGTSFGFDRRKGYDLLLEALERIRKPAIQFVFYGSVDTEATKRISFHIRDVGILHDDLSLATLYSAADVMVVPSRQENLSNTIMESLSCGTPVVAFDIGGNADMIEHHNNGYLATPFDAADLARGIEWVLAETHRWRKMSVAAREKIVRNFDYTVVAPRYVALYRKIIERKKSIRS